MTVIPLDELVPGTWYHGEGRFIKNLAYWTGTEFVGLNFAFGRYETNTAGYGERGFDPMERVEPQGFI